MLERDVMPAAPGLDRAPQRLVVGVVVDDDDLHAGVVEAQQRAERVDVWRSKVDWKRSPTWNSMLMAPMVSALAVMRSRSPVASKCRTAVPAGKTRQSTE